MTDAFHHIKSGAFVMIDVDGSEKEVIQKLSTYIKSKKLNKISFLIETDFHADGTSNKQELLEELGRLEFTIEDVIECDPRGKSRFSPIASQLFPSYLDQMICALERGNSNQSWIIAIKE